ncbi:MAG: hypothetical protein IH921_01625 [Gemmatimonadetes bacterium]|nr:hypothetical protein [Gemmatimonadota bacterium]
MGQFEDRQNLPPGTPVVGNIIHTAFRPGETILVIDFDVSQNFKVQGDSNGIYGI